MEVVGVAGCGGTSGITSVLRGGISRSFAAASAGTCFLPSLRRCGVGAVVVGWVPGGLGLGCVVPWRARACLTAGVGLSCMRGCGRGSRSG